MVVPFLKHSPLEAIRTVEYRVGIFNENTFTENSPDEVYPFRLDLAEVLSDPHYYHELDEYERELDSAMQNHATVFSERQFGTEKNGTVVPIIGAVYDEMKKIAHLLRDELDVEHIWVADPGRIPDVVLGRYNAVSEATPRVEYPATEAARLSMLDLVSVISVLNPS